MAAFSPVFMAPLLVVAFLSVISSTTAQGYGMFFGCPCGADAETSRKEGCQECLAARCGVGGGTIERRCAGKPWCTKASAVWRKHCDEVASEKVALLDARALCYAVSCCSEACVSQHDVHCLPDCQEALMSAQKACSAIPWPVDYGYTWPTPPPPPTTVTTTLDMAIFG
mmetsp:Transcript_13061/g.19804  ORF Transcript_13061/g.19804 Transcript_13061/m.19804 type:complete len:169 (+) Transcript_13061:66-572(+)